MVGRIHALLVSYGVTLFATPSIALVTPPTWTQSTSSKLRTEGYVTLPPEVTVGQELADAVALECHTRLNTLLDAADAAGCNVLEQQYSFAEICHRKRLRWDTRIEDSPAWQQLVSNAVALAAPLFEEIAGGADNVRVVMSGAVISRPGALEQSFHADGEGGLYNIFVPLVDVEANADGTQFWPGSHLADPSMESVVSLPDDDAAMEAMASPGCQRGGLICFDYRTIHRGLPSSGRERAVAYIVVATESSARDRKNFPDLSVHDASSDHTEYVPFFDERTGDTWRATLPRLTAATMRLSRVLCRTSPDGVSEKDARLQVREYCRSNGLDEHCNQARLAATNALLRESESK